MTRRSANRRRESCERSPTTRKLGAVVLEQLRGAVMGAPLPLSESLMIAWPQTVGLIAGTILLFALG